MKTNRAGNDLDYVVDIDNIWNERSKYLLVSSIVFSSDGKKNVSSSRIVWKQLLKKERNMIFICVKILY